MAVLVNAGVVVATAFIAVVIEVSVAFRVVVVNVVVVAAVG